MKRLASRTDPTLEATQDAAALTPSRWLRWTFEAPRGRVLLLTCVMVATILALDTWIHANISVGILYIIPLVIAASKLQRWQLVLMGVLAAVVTEQHHPSSWDTLSLARVFYTFIGFAGAGLLSYELVSSRRMAFEYSRRLQEQVMLRREAEGQMLSLIESSPAAIVTLDSSGRIDLANQAAHEMLLIEVGELSGRSVRDFLPVMADLLQSSAGDVPYRTATNCRGRRSNGESFMACVWFATYTTRAGKRLAAIITDSSDDLRDWQETSLQSLLRSTRVLVGSVSHEIRNICAAIGVVHANLGRIAGVAQTEDYSALGTLSQGLARLATVELHASGEQELGSVNLNALLEEFRIVVEPALAAAEIDLKITAEPDLPLVLGDHHGLLQAMLNLSRNSTRAMEESTERRLTVTASSHADHVLVAVEDSGPGVKRPERLFQPFQQGADAVGLGLFVSRAIVRACEGELYHEPTERGCRMCLRLKPGLAGEAAAETQTLEVFE